MPFGCVYVVHFPVKMWTCINHSTCVFVYVCVCVCELLAGGGVLTGQSRAFLLGGDVMRTSSPLADRQPCLCSPPEEKPHCVSECVCVCVCVCAWMCVCVSVWLRYWLMGEVGKPRGTREGLLSPAAQGEGTTYWCLPLKHAHRKRKFLMFFRAQ